ncbi:MAG: hypothetical protein P0120_06030 [Nitrospira sp.]|nr:hypothetical protein [Nitrospira sp.]
MVRARQLAIEALTERCSDRYNPVMVPGNVAGFKGWAIYLLAATTEPEDIIVGGHVRVDVSEDELKVLQASKLSKSCLQLKATRDTAGIVVTELIAEMPTEIHVYLNLVWQKPIYVSARAGLWKVEGGKILFVKDGKSD